MRIELSIYEGEYLMCGSCSEIQGPGKDVFIGDTEEQRFAVLCLTCITLEEKCIADGIEFTGVTNPEDLDEFSRQANLNEAAKEV